MSQLKGFDEYMEAQTGRSMMEEQGVGNTIVWHLHGARKVVARLAESSTYEVVLQPENGEPIPLHKTQIKFFHATEHADALAERLKVDPEVRARNLEPILQAGARHIVKNKTLYVLMREQRVTACTLLEGELLRGLIGDFTRYELLFYLKSGVPVSVLRHAILDLSDKQGRCQLKAVQDRRKDWKRSELYNGGA